MNPCIYCSRPVTREDGALFSLGGVDLADHHACRRAREDGQDIRDGLLAAEQGDLFAEASA